MSDRTPPPARRRIAGETPAPAPAKKAPAAKKKAPAKKAAAKTESQAATKTPVKAAAPVVNKAVAKKTPAAQKKAPAVASPTAKKAPVAKKAPAAKTTPAPVAAVARPAARTSSGSTVSRFSVLMIGVAALALIAGAVVGVLGFRSWNGTSLVDSQEQAASAARNASETIFSFSFDKLDEHTKDSKALMTPAYAKQFDAVSPALTDIAPQREITVTSVTRNAAALPCGDECSTSKVSVLVFLDQDRRLADDDTATVFGNRIVVEMVKTDGDWKVNDIRAL